MRTLMILIDSLNLFANKKASAVSLKDNIEYEIERKNNHLEVMFRINRLVFSISLPFSCLKIIKNWLKDIIDAKEFVCTIQISGYDFHYSHQLIGSHPEMGQFWISKNYPYKNEFNAYVNTKEFVSGFYLSIMTKLGFCLYDDIGYYPSWGKL